MTENNVFEIENGVLKAYTGEDARIRIPEGVHTIGEGVFKGMAWLLEVELPSTLKKIGESAFKGCRRISGFNFPEGLEEIGEYAFHRCHDLEEAIFPKSVTKVGSHAFLYCDGLKRVVLEGPKSLGRAAFSHNLSLREIALNKDLDGSNFADEVFEGCVLLQKISLSGETYEIGNLIEAMDSHSPYPGVIRSIAKSVYHSLQIEDGMLCTFNINLKNITLPEGITAIGKACFFDKKGIVSLILPESLREIRANAFLNCTSLEEITIQNENLTLDDKAFRGCCNLKKVHLSGKTYSLEEETGNELADRIRDQVLGDFCISGRVLIRYTGDEEQVTIPKEVEIIGERCFFDNERIKWVYCPEGLEEIREEAFSGCVALQNISLPGTLKRVERMAFAECKKLLKCNIPDTVEFIGEYAFRRCFTLKPFEPWPEHADIHPYAFYKAGNFSEITEKLREALTIKERTAVYAGASDPYIEELVIDEPERVIGREEFAYLPKLKKVRMHVKALSEGTFAYCRNLEEIELQGITELPAKCFSGCYKLSFLEAKDIKKIGARCFDECIGLESFDLTGIEEIGERAFERCDGLKSVRLDRTVCGYHAFADCAGLESIAITSDTVLKSGAFIGCTQIKEIGFGGEKYSFSRFADSLNRVGNLYPAEVREVIASIYSCFVIRDGKTIGMYTGDSTTVTVPGDIEELGQDVFRDHVRLKQISIPPSVKIFGSHAFSMTEWLDAQREKTDMVIINGVLVDGAACRGRVVIPWEVTRVSSWCFAGNIDITELVIPSERIAIEALSFRNCINLKRITDWDNNEYTLEAVSDIDRAGYPEPVQRIFSECINCFKLDNEGNLLESTGNITKLTFPRGIRSVGEGVYRDCHLLETIELAEDTASIGRSAFESSKWLKSVTGAKNIESIGAMAFSGCQSLESIDLSDNLTSLGKRCFEHCCSLGEIHISAKLEMIPERAFFRCKSLKTLSIPSSVKEIGEEAFAFCDGLEEVRIPEGTKVADSAFAYCDSVRLIRY